MEKSIRTEIVINANKEQVYSVLTDFENYKIWNPFIVRSEGKPVLNSKLVNTMKNGSKLITFKPKVTAVVPNERFEWLGSLFVKGLFDGRHYFIIQEIGDNQVNLVHGEEFSGILSSYVLKKIGDETRKNFVEMNLALKNFIESK